MKLGSLARSVVRYFRPAATSVSPQIDPEAIIALMIDRGLIASRPDPAPPKAAETTIGGPNVMPWAEWQQMIDGHPIYDGWTFCKFGVRGPGDNDRGEVIGIVRSGFGTYWCRFYVVVDGVHHDAQHIAVTISARSGYAIGIFANMDIAVEAAEIAMRMKLPIDGDPFSPEVKPRYHRLTDALGAAGFQTGSIICRPLVNGAVVPGQPIPVWTKPSYARPAEVRLS